MAEENKAVEKNEVSDVPKVHEEQNKDIPASGKIIKDEKEVEKLEVYGNEEEKTMEVEKIS